MTHLELNNYFVQFQFFASKGCSRQSIPAPPRCADCHNNGMNELKNAQGFHRYSYPSISFSILFEYFILQWILHLRDAVDDRFQQILDVLTGVTWDSWLPELKTFWLKYITLHKIFPFAFYSSVLPHIFRLQEMQLTTDSSIPSTCWRAKRCGS